MKMKTILYLIACLFSSLVVQAADLTPEEERFRSNILQFLKEEGFSPTIDEDDNSVTFKKEGDLHWITVSGSSPYYVEIHRSGFNCNTANRDIVIAAVNEGNKNVRCAKAMLLESSISLAVEMYCHSTEEFRYVFYKNMDELATLEKTVYNYYNEHSENSSSAPFTIKSVSIANTDYDGSIITDYDARIYSYKTKYLTPKIYVDVKKVGKYDIYVKLYTPSGLSKPNAGSSLDGYSYKTSVSLSEGTNAYVLPGWGGSKSGHWAAGEYRFEFYYEDEMIGKHSFKIN